MNNLNKLTLGCAAVLMFAACGDEASHANDPSMAGSTNEPNATQTANLTDEQIAMLNKAFNTLVDTVVIIPNSANCYTICTNSIPSTCEERCDPVDSATQINPARLNIPFDSKPQTKFDYKSLDERMTCRVMYYDVEPGLTLNREYNSAKNYLRREISESTEAIQFAEINGEAIVITTIGGASYNGGFWGPGVTCSEKLEQFKDECNNSSGLFRDFGDGCRSRHLSVGCARIMREGETAESVLENREQDYIDICKADSAMYSATDSPDNAPESCYGSYTVIDGETVKEENCTTEEDNSDSTAKLHQEWRTGVINDKKTQSDYIHQFTPDMDSIDGMLYVHDNVEFYSDAEAYSGFDPSGLASEFSEEGIYKLPDSLVATIFPTKGKDPLLYRYSWDSNAASAYFAVVIKDRGAKGHALRKIDAGTVQVNDFVKVGNCAEDTSTHYSAFLITGSKEWDPSGKTFKHKNVESPLWNCDNPESLEAVDPYKEWSDRN